MRSCRSSDTQLLHRLLGQEDQTDSPTTTRLAPLSLAIDRYLWILAIAGFSLALTATLLSGRVILQARQIHSVPFIMGFRVAAPSHWQAGDLVEFRTRDLRPYYPAGTLFTKAIAAVPGDGLIRLGRDFYVNGRYVATARETDSQGRPAVVFTPPSRPLPLCSQLPLDRQSCREVATPLVPKDHLFVLGTHERSFDSRYWGIVGPEEIVGRVAALW